MHSVTHIIAPEDTGKSQCQYLDVEQKGPALHVFEIQCDLVRDRQVVATVYLRPAGQSGNQMVNAPLRSQFCQVVLVEQGRPWSDKTHVTPQDTPDLRQFIQAAASQEATYRRQMRLGIGK